MTEDNSMEYQAEVILQRRNETLRRMLSTPPQQHAKAPPQAARSRKKADAADASQASDKPEKD